MSVSVSESGFPGRRRRLREDAQRWREKDRGIELDWNDPRPGEVYALQATAALEVLWTVAEVRGGPGENAALKVRLVAADLAPAIGSRDVRVPFGPLAPGVATLRCGFALWARPGDLAPAKGIGRLGDGVHQQLRHKLDALESIRPDEVPAPASVAEGEVDDDPEYEDWIEDGPARALRILAALAAAPRSQDPPAWQQDLADPGLLALLRQIHILDSRPHLGTGRPSLPSPAVGGWGLVISRDEPPEVHQALQLLLEHRRRQLGDDKVRILEFPAGDSWSQWLARHGVAAGSPRWDLVPAYLLLVGSRERIPLEIQRRLGLEYAVGRLDLEGPEDYRVYGEKVRRLEERLDSGPVGESSAILVEDLLWDGADRSGASEGDLWNHARRVLADDGRACSVLVGGGLVTVGVGTGSIAVADARRMVREGLRAGLPAGLALRPVAAVYAAAVLRLEELHRQRSWGRAVASDELARLEAEAEGLGRIVLLGDPAIMRESAS